MLLHINQVKNTREATINLLFFDTSYIYTHKTKKKNLTKHRMHAFGSVGFEKSSFGYKKKK